MPTCKKCGKNHLGELFQGTNVCYKCGKEGHNAKGCTARVPNDNRQNWDRNQGSQLKLMQAMIERPTEVQERKED